MSQAQRYFNKQLLPYYAAGAVLLLTICAVVFSFIITGKTRRGDDTATSTPIVIEDPTSTVTLVPRKLDGVLVLEGQDNLQPRAVMIDNMIDARPQAGIADANVVFEVPAEGGITRFLAVFDASSTVAQIGPVRSARPYFVDWAKSFNAAYFHVGGSPDAIEKLATMGKTIINIDEIGKGQYFWRSNDRLAPHNTFTSTDRMNQAVDKFGTTGTTITAGLRFKEAASSTTPTISAINIPYGGSYNVTWNYRSDTNSYQRNQAKKPHVDAAGNTVQATNVIVMKTDSKVLDEKGRLQLRTTGSGDAFLYRDGNRYSVQWRRSPNEPLRLESIDGNDIELNRGTTWIEVVTDSVAFSGFQPATTTSTSTAPIVSTTSTR